jgi:adenylate cyclase
VAARPGASDPSLPPPAAADRRAVTVLFADLAGFTTLSERLDPEDVRNFQSELFGEMSAAVAEFQGFVEKFVGDAVMAVFGAPVAHEDDPERAVRAALSMHERMARLSQRWQTGFGGPVALHVGVHTGPVVAGTIGVGASAAYAVTGDTVNTAARLQSATPGGHTLVSEATWSLTRHAFAFEPLGELSLKGKTDAVPVYRLIGRLEGPTSARGLEKLGLAAPLVGRAGELAEMLAAFDRMPDGGAQVVSLIGDAGSGKSRLQLEFFRRLDASGRLSTTTVGHAACSSLGEQPYGVLAAFLREAYGIGPGNPLAAARAKLALGLAALGAGADEVGAIAPLIGYVLGLESGESLRHVEPEQLKRQIFLAAWSLIDRKLQHGSLVFVVEDLHWADAASIELLRFLVDRLADRPLMLLVTYRPTFDAHAIVDGPGTSTPLVLRALSSADSDALLTAFFGRSVDRLPASLRELIATRGGGNPFFLEEIVRGLIERGVLRRHGETWTCAADVATVDVPLTIQGLLLSRLDRLPSGARQLIHEAAVAGPTFDDRLLRMVASEPDACDAHLAVLREAQLVEEPLRAVGDAAPARSYRFAHALVHEVVYQNLLLRRRTELHGRAGRALETLCGAQPQRLEDLEALGHHFRLSGDKSKGVRYLVAAGDWARAIYANDDAARHYEQALETLAEYGGPTEGIAVRERLGDLLAPAGRRDAALDHYETVRAASEAIGDRPAQARLCRKIGNLHWDAGDRDRAMAGYRAGLALLEQYPEHIELAHLYQEMGRLAFRTGDNIAAIKWAERALAQAARLTNGTESAAGDGERHEAVAATAQAYNTLGVALARTERLDEAVARIEESVAVAEANGLLQAACRGYTNLGVLYSTHDPARAIATCLRGLEVAKKIGDLGFQSRLYANLAVAYCALTNRCDEEGVRAAHTAIEIDRRLGQLDHLAIPLIVLGQIYQCHGEPARALDYYREAVGLAEEIGEPQLLFPCYDGLATLYLEVGDDTEAERYMQKAQAVCERAGLEPDALVVLPFLS